MKKPWLTVRNLTEPNSTELLINGPISTGESWFDFNPSSFDELKDSLKEVPTTNRLLVGINSPGGEVFAGLPIYRFLRTWPGGVTTRIDGRADSIASIIWLAGDKRLTPKFGTALVHQVWSGVVGNADEIEKAAAEIRVLDSQLAEVYADNSTMTKKEALAQMAKAERLGADRLMELGLATEIEDLSTTPKTNSADSRMLAAQYLNFCGEVPQFLNNAAPPQKPKTNMQDQAPAATQPAPATPPTPANNNEPQVTLTKDDIKLIIAEAFREHNASAADVPDPRMIGGKPIEGTQVIQNLGNPLIEKYEAMSAGPDRLKFGVQNFDRLTAHRRQYAPQGSNTISSSLYPNIAIDASIEVLRNKLAALNAFTQSFTLQPMKPLVPIVITENTAGPTIQTNATDFTAGNSTLAPITITPARLTGTVHLTDAQMNNGIQMRNLGYMQAGNLADAINDVVTALMVTGTFGTALTVGAAANFTASDLAPVIAAAKNYRRKNLLLDGGHMAYLLPTSRESFAFGEQGAFGLDLLVENNRWTGATTNTVGFVCSPTAIVVASGMSVEAPSKFYESIATQQLENGMGVRLWVWFDPNTQIMYSMLDLLFGAAVADATAGELLVTA